MKILLFLTFLSVGESVQSQDSMVYAHHSTIMHDQWRFYSEDGFQTGKVVEEMRWDDGQIIRGSGFFRAYPDRIVLDSLTFTRIFLPGFGCGKTDTAWIPWFTSPLTFYRSKKTPFLLIDKKLIRKRKFKGYDVVYKRVGVATL
ncbi:MAG: hypothetical protein EOO88_01290 [Pedobacter sp.]|nr:MAG: hypothetical protein EOO88_01290 [Pedobacter sp.]